MITTPELIDALVANAPPVRRLRPPLVRAGFWLLFAVFILGLIAVSHGIRSDLAQKAQGVLFSAGIAASLLTGISAAIAAFLVSLPDRSRLWLMLPLPPLIAWMSTIGYSCLTPWVGLAPTGVRIDDLARCFATLVLTGLPLSAAMLVMLRHAVPARPTAVAMVGSLAVAALTATALLVVHDLDATIMILIWNLGIAAIIVGLATAFGRTIFSRFAPSLSVGTRT